MRILRRDLEFCHDLPQEIKPPKPRAPEPKEAPKPGEPNTYQKLLQARQSAQSGKQPGSAKARAIGTALEAFLKAEGFPIVTEPPAGIVHYHLNIEGEEIKILSIRNNINIGVNIGTDTIYLLQNVEELTQDTINTRICAWIYKRLIAKC